jgi:organic radical activating enzyme
LHSIHRFNSKKKGINRLGGIGQNGRRPMSKYAAKEIFLTLQGEGAKAGAPLAATSGSELKLVFPQEGLRPEDLCGLAFAHFWLQPMDGDELAVNTAAAIAYCLDHPRWRLSLQTHKFLGIP